VSHTLDALWGCQEKMQASRSVATPAPALSKKPMSIELKKNPKKGI